MKAGDLMRMKNSGTPNWHGGVVGIYMGPADEKEWGPDYHAFMVNGTLKCTDGEYVKNKLEVISESR